MLHAIVKVVTSATSYSQSPLLIMRTCSVPLTNNRRTIMDITAEYKEMKPGTIVFPPNSRQLPALPMEPLKFPDEKGKEGRDSMFNTKRVFEFRGMEQIHNELIYKQFAIVAQAGGLLEPDNFSTIRHFINANMTDKRFAVWRVEAPWYTRHRSPRGVKRGAGKGKVHHYLTPIRNGRVIVEVGGYLLYEEAQAFLAPLADNLPFKARFVSQSDLEQEATLRQQIEKENLNPINWELFCRFNMQNCHIHLSPYEMYWRGKGK